MEALERIRDYRTNIIESTQDIIKIKSVEDEPRPNMPFGKGVNDALKFMLDLAKEMGFKTENLDGYVGYAELGDGDETVGILVHLDVVPEGDGWIYPPYGGEIHDGKIYGRGAIDNKGPAIAIMYAMKALKETKTKLRRRIRIIFGTNEETGWGCMKYYFKHERFPDLAFTPDADFPVIYGEKGIININLVKKLESNIYNNTVIKRIMGGNAPNMVPDWSEVILKSTDGVMIKEKLDKFINGTNYPLSLQEQGGDIKIIAKGVSAHGSTPEKGKNAISYLMAFLGYLFKGSYGICEFINMYNERIGFNHYGEKIGCGFEDDISGKLKFNPGLISANKNEIRLLVNIRYPIKSSSKDVYNGIRNNLKGTGIELIEGDSDMEPLYVPKEHFLVDKLMQVYRRETGDKDSKPITIGGGTYARALENAVAFGPMFPGQQDVAHQKNEYISIDHLTKITRIYLHALYELAR